MKTSGQTLDSSPQENNGLAGKCQTESRHGAEGMEHRVEGESLVNAGMMGLFYHWALSVINSQSIIFSIPFFFYINLKLT